jgi:hypothetical protein
LVEFVQNTLASFLQKRPTEPTCSKLAWRWIQE